MSRDLEQLLNQTAVGPSQPVDVTEINRRVHRRRWTHRVVLASSLSALVIILVVVAVGLPARHDPVPPLIGESSTETSESEIAGSQDDVDQMTELRRRHIDRAAALVVEMHRLLDQQAPKIAEHLDDVNDQQRAQLEAELAVLERELARLVFELQQLRYERGPAQTEQP